MINFKLLIIFIFSKIIKITNKEKNLSTFNGIYLIKNTEVNLYFYIQNNRLILANRQKNFRLELISSNLYIIKSRIKNQRIGVDENNNIIIYNKKKNIKNLDKIYWNIIQINNSEFLIQNKYNKKYIESINNKLQLSNKIIYNLNNQDNLSLKKNYIFTFIRLFQDDKLKIKKQIIIKEPIDLLIKYIDLNDMNLMRDNITQIYKDKDNEELRYCLRSILQYISWIRKIFILMPNEKVKYLKNIEEIKEKIIYIKDKDLLGYDTANIHAFTFNLYKMEKYGISNNFIYMEDDFFIGYMLKKYDFFYYYKNKKKVFPYILSSYFYELNKIDILNKYYQKLKTKDLIHPHSKEGWRFSILSTSKYFIEKFNNFSIINGILTHNAIPENTNDLKLIFEEIQKYNYINETLFCKMRHILTLNKHQFFNLYSLNILKRKVNSIPYKYIPIELLNKFNLNVALFVINTGGNHIPLKRQVCIQKKIMEKRFPIKVIYERVKNQEIHIIDCIKNYFYQILRLFILTYIYKIYELIINQKCFN